MALGHMCQSVIWGNTGDGHTKDHIDDNWFLQFLLGLAIATFLANVSNNWIAIGSIFFISISAIAISYIVYNLRSMIREVKRMLRCIRSQNLMVLIFVPLIIIIASSKASEITHNMDEMGYYLSTVKWIEHGPTTSGIALLNGRLAINSAWHMVSSVFGYDFIYSGGAYDLNALLFCFIFIIGLRSGIRLYRSESSCRSADLLLLSTVVFPFHYIIDSMDADYPAIFISIFLLSLLLRRISDNRICDIDSGYYGYLIVSLFLFTVKPLTGLLLLYPFMITIYHFLKNKYTPLLLFVGLSFLYVLPWIYKNYLISGCMVFPIRIIDLYDPVWKLPNAYVRNIGLVISEFAKVEMIREDYLYSGVEHVGISQWLPIWIQNNWSLWIGKFVIIIWPICAAISLMELLILKAKSQEWYFKIILFAITLLWFYHFPSIRFGWAYLLAFIILSGVGLVELLKINDRILFYALVIMLFFSICKN